MKSVFSTVSGVVGASGSLPYQLGDGPSQPVRTVSSRASDSLLLQCGFSVFAVWFLSLPQIAIFNSSTIYELLSLALVPFVAAFVLFALLARARRLPRVHITAAISSVVTFVACFVFLFAQNSLTHLVSFCVLMVLAAYFLIAWGSVLRNLVFEDAFTLMLKALLAIGAFRLLTCLPRLVSGEMYNLHTHYNYVLAFLAVLVLVQGLYFALNIPKQTSYQAFDASEDKRKGDFYIDWKRQGFLPLIVILFVAFVLVTAFSGFIYRPYMFDQIQSDLLQSAVELALAVIALLSFWVVQKSQKNAQTHLDFVTFLTVVFRIVLLLAILSLALTFLGQGGVFFAQALLKVLSDISLFLAMLFVIASTNRNRSDFFSRFLLSVTCSGILWAFALGSEIKRLVGFDAQTVAVAAMIATALIAMLFVFALMTTKSHGQVFTVESTAKPSLASGQALPEEAPTWPRAEIRRASEKALASFSLSRRELQVANYLIEGLTYQAIAEKLGVTSGTVRGYVKSLYQKCNVNSKPMLISLVTGDAQDASSDSTQDV